MTPEEIQRITELSTQIAEIWQAIRDENPNPGVFRQSVDSLVRSDILRTNLAIAEERLRIARAEIVKANIAPTPAGHQES